jgi:hypothetical protein
MGPKANNKLAPKWTEKRLILNRPGPYVILNRLLLICPGSNRLKAALAQVAVETGCV